MFCAYHKETTRFLRVFRNTGWQNAIYLDQGACTKAINRAVKVGQIKAGDYAVLPMDEFKKIEKTEVVYNKLSGQPVVQSVNTPLCCDPSSDAYWEM